MLEFYSYTWVVVVNPQVEYDIQFVEQSSGPD